MLASQPITFPKRHITNTKKGVVSTNSVHRKRQPLCIKQLPLTGYEVLEHISVRAVEIIISLADARLAMVDSPSADAEFGADFALYHAVHVAIQNGKFQCGEL